MDEAAGNDESDVSDRPIDGIWETSSTTQPDTMTSNTSTVDEMATTLEVNPEDINEFNELELFKYHLRPQSREVKSSFTRTWIDRDESGNYGEKDPNDELRRVKRQRDRVRRNAEIERTESDDERPIKVSKFVVTLEFPSEAGKAKFNYLINNLPTTTKPQHDEVKFNGYRLRTRGSALSTRYYSEANLVKSQFDPGLPDDLTGYPAARGCWECLGLGLRCPLLDDERAWPCVTCLDDDHDCDLVTPPEFKRACERCKRRKTSCSYLYTHQHGEACQQCMNDGYRCVAGPAKDTIPTRLRYDRDWENDPLQKQKPFKVRKVPNHTETADLRTDEPSTNVTQCELHEDEGFADMEPSQFEFQGHESARSATHEHKRKFGEGERTDTPPSKVQRTSKSSQAITRTISTKFCHPIIFNHHDAADGTSCHFCSDPSYSIFGLEEKQVEVFEWKDGRGLEEISGGHKGEGVENTRICLQCTTERIPIMMCRSHDLRPLQGVENDTFDLNDAFAELMSGSGKLRGTWCAICANLAQYECCTPADEGDGCGLVVCEQCMVELTGIYEGDLQKMLPCMSKQPSQERVFGLRADYDFLKEDGLLMRYVLWNSQP